MVWLIFGVLLWSAVHSIPSAARPLRGRLIERVGAQPYQGLFALSIVASIVLMVVGWRATPPVPVYIPPSWGRTLASPLTFVAFILFVASAVTCNLKRFLRHPQLTGVATWAGAHLLANGESRSLVLFGALGLWSIVAMLLINRRDGAWQKPEALPWVEEVKPLAGGTLAWLVLLALHSWLFGVSPFPG